MRPVRSGCVSFGGRLRFKSLHIENFRGIHKLELRNLRDLVVIAGPNGCGKSACLDAIRLLKSFYGGYQLNEWHQWMGEFQINLQRPSELRKLFGDPRRILLVAAELEFAREETDYLKEHSTEILSSIVWRRTLGRNFTGTLMSAEELRHYGPQVNAGVAKMREDLVRELEATNTFTAGFTIKPSGEIEVESSTTVEVVFQTYEPEHIGVIDYHSSSRTYERENLGGVNLNLDSLTEQRKGHLLYNWREKYRNVKTELASHYVRDAIAVRAGANSMIDLNQTLTELFQTFFPDKTYRGPAPQSDGSLQFPVMLTNGAVHDIDDLSSGEKEILYGYLRLRNSAPRNSVVLIDEPELHLNPRLLQGFSDFYHAHLGRALNNQLWLVTHSDALLRQAVGNTEYSVYHMSPSTSTGVEENQAIEVVASDDVEQAIVALVGDLAAYRPRAKVVLFEGGGDSEVDVMIVSRLFPAVAEKLNFVPGGHKRRVRDLYGALSDAAARAGLSERFYAVLDRDREELELPPGTNIMKWDQYHIENYLLHESSLRSALATVRGRPVFETDEQVTAALVDCASTLVDKLVLERLQDEVNNRLIHAIKIGASPTTTQPGVDLLPSITGSLDRLRDVGVELSSGAWLGEAESRHRSVLSEALTSGGWRSEFPGRDILKRFVERYASGASYEVFRNITLEKMVEVSVQPEGLKKVLSDILAA
jgi:hypothetical protein